MSLALYPDPFFPAALAPGFAFALAALFGFAAVFFATQVPFSPFAGFLDLLGSGAARACGWAIGALSRFT
jgi:hypothetical protein